VKYVIINYILKDCMR